MARRGRTAEAEALYRETMRRFPDDRHSRLDLGLLLVRLGRREGAEALSRELERMGDSGADTIKACLAGAKGTEKPSLSPKPALDIAAWAGLKADAAAVRCDFLLSDGFAKGKGLVLSTPAVRQSLQAEARAKLADLIQKRPGHPVVRLIAQRHGVMPAGKAMPLPDEVSPDDYPLRLELARQAKELRDFPALFEHFAAERPLTAVLWLLDDHTADPPAGFLAGWL
ncbi:MAG: hypothetical protein H7841_02030, partial [Magnetospirillum sp. WYHS-4]